MSDVDAGAATGEGGTPSTSDLPTTTTTTTTTGEASGAAAAPTSDTTSPAGVTTPAETATPASSGSGGGAAAGSGSGSGSAEPPITSLSGGSAAAARAPPAPLSSGGGSGGASTSAMAVLRLKSDLLNMARDPPSGCSASPVTEDNLFHWDATIVGPDETPWEGGIFSLRLQFPDQYPSKPPRVRFTSSMFHPNVYPDGTICLDIIQDLWKPIYTVGMMLASIQSLLTDPNCNSPANLDAAQLLKENPKEYRKRVRRIAQRSVEG